MASPFEKIPCRLKPIHRNQNQVFITNTSIPMVSNSELAVAILDLYGGHIGFHW